MSSLTALREKHARLVYRGYQYHLEGTDLVLVFDLFLEPNIAFHPTVRLTKLPSALIEQLTREALHPTLDRLFFHLGMAEIPSYYKAACPPLITIEHQGQLSQADLPFWHNLLRQGLGEFYYRNQIDFTKPDFLHIELVEGATNKHLIDTNLTLTKNTHTQSPILVPIGGGKDSATLLCMLEDKQLRYDALLLAPHSIAAKEMAMHMQKQGSCQNIIEVERSIDPQLIALNQQGYFNGHTPFSAYLAFLSTTVASLYGHAHIYLGNEKSSEEENLLWLGQAINHQYSKSLEFEELFRSYSAQVLFQGQPDAPVYRSALRNLNELEITGKLVEFAKQSSVFAQFLTMMRSCNVGQKQGMWCHDCPKCAFVFLLLSAHLDASRVRQEIFQENLFAKPSLRQTFLDLAGLGDKKPFECVGSFAEVQTAFLQTERRNQLRENDLTFFVRSIKKHQRLQALEQKSVLILGLGKEGHSTLQWIQSKFPKKHLAIADQKDQSQTLANYDTTQLTTYFGPQYLDHLSNYDIIIKTAGIPITLPEIQKAIRGGSEIWSNTQLFFDFCEAEHIVGITGTKGKSTTSQLSYELLKAAHPNTVLLGNIGKPALSQLAMIDKHTWVVAELSCHQLAELDTSPDISIVLDIKSEHLDYYSSFEAYFEAKTAIARFQKQNDYLIYNPELTGSNAMAQLSPAQKLIHSLHDEQALAFVQDGQIYLHQEALLPVAEIPLLGQHNLYNILPAVVLAAQLQTPRETICSVLQQFTGLPHRLEIVDQSGGITFVNDSIAVNPHAAIMAVQSFPKGSVILLAGGYERTQDFSELVSVLAAQHIKHLITLPDTGERLYTQAKQQNIASTQVNTLQEAVALAKTLAQPGDVVLLSPASASYNSFSNYEERGRIFTSLVKNSA